MAPLHADEYLRLCTQIPVVGPGPGVPGVPGVVPGGPHGPILPGGPVVPSGPVIGPYPVPIPQVPVDPGTIIPGRPGEPLPESQSGVATEVPCVSCDKCSNRSHNYISIAKQQFNTFTQVSNIESLLS